MKFTNSFQNSVHCSVLDKLFKRLFKTDTLQRYSMFKLSGRCIELFRKLCIFAMHF